MKQSSPESVDSPLSACLKAPPRAEWRSAQISHHRPEFATPQQFVKFHKTSTSSKQSKAAIVQRSSRELEQAVSFLCLWKGRFTTFGLEPTESLWKLGVPDQQEWAIEPQIDAISLNFQMVFFRNWTTTWTREDKNPPAKLAENMADLRNAKKFPSEQISEMPKSQLLDSLSNVLSVY